MKILIVDDELTNRMILSAILKKEGYSIVSAVNGQEAVDVFQQEEPDLVLMDIMMPIMDGYEATKKIKTLSEEKFTPIIFLTAMTDEQALRRCVDVGGDDFLSKPYNQVIIKAKIDALERMSQLYNTVYKQKRELLAHQEYESKEQEVARKVFDSILNPGCLSAENIKLHLSPMSLFNGDVVLAAVKPTGGLHILFGDFTGHGLAASLGALPLSDIFYSMTAKGYSIHDVVREINRKLKLQLPTGMFLAACLVEIDTINNILKYWNGAIPAAWLHKGDSVVELKSRHLPLGILDDSSFSDKVVFLDCLQVNMCKTETETEETDLFQHILDTLDDFIEGQEQSDDVTLGVISCDINYINQLACQRGSYKKFVPTHWEFELLFYYDCIKTIDPVPLINQIMAEIQGHQVQQDKLSTVLTELFCNALDHGLLELDSSIKSSAEGFMQFYTDKEERLNNLSKGSIKITIKHTPHENGGDLYIGFEDSGKGFDVSSLSKASDKPEAQMFSGRGLSLIKSYCKSVNYNDTGNVFIHGQILNTNFYWNCNV